MATQTTTSTTVFSPVPPAADRDIPPLQNGDRLTREEFERRYRAMPHVRKAELIEGEVHMPSPVRYRNHSVPHKSMIYFLETYSLSTPGVESGLEATVRLDPLNVQQPDAFLFIQGGQARISEDDYLELAPELVAEIAASSVSIDVHKKFEAYRRNGVMEYIVWRVEDQAIDWFVLRNGQYEKVAADPNGIYKSEVFPGLWLDSVAMLQGNLQRVIEIVQMSVASPEHQQFVQRPRAIPK
ncbi:MAG: Uma2 family endonuclease [Gemmataceae bacterium]